MRYELAAGHEPVEVTVKDDVVTAILGPVTVTFQTHRDADAWDDRKEMVDALHAAQPALIEAVDRVKLTHAVDQAMLVLYAKDHDLSMSEANTALSLESSEAHLRATGEWSRYIRTARTAARELLADALSEHGWTHIGPTIGRPPQEKARVIDLNTGEMVATQQMLRGGFEFRHHEWAWVDFNGMEVEDERAGDWWRIVGAVRELPFDPWSAELEYIAGL